MGKVDCVMEAIENGKIEIAVNFLKNSSASLEEISENTGLSLEKVRELKSNL
jgi:predicted HTH domain antitoxin